MSDLTRRAVLAGVGGTLAAVKSHAATFAPQPLYSGAEVLDRARGALGRRTAYVMGAHVPPTAQSWPNAGMADCSSFVLWCFGLSRKQFPFPGNDGSTDAIYLDVVNPAGGIFRRVSVPCPGAIVVYPSYGYPGESDSGHIGLITSVEKKVSCRGGALWKSGQDGGIDEARCFEVIDCSSSAWWTLGDAIQSGAYTKFIAHDGVVSLNSSRRAPPRRVPNFGQQPSISSANTRRAATTGRTSIQFSA